MLGRLARIVGLLLLAAVPCFSQVTYDSRPKKYSSYSLTSNKWTKTTITYWFRNTTRDFPNSEAAIRQAFDIWTKASGLTFVESPSQPADITIVWKSLNDNNTLAQASFPVEDTEVQFNEDEQWADSVQNGNGQPLDLVTVAAHEIGHALGLDHSNDKNALMYPTYLKSHRYLAPDDIAGIQALYPKENAVLPGTVTFDIKKNRPFRIGSDEFTFDIDLSECSTNCVYAYSDDVAGVAAIEGVTEIEQVQDPTGYDMSSRVRTINKGKLFVLKNRNGYYAIIKVEDVSYKGSGVEADVSVSLSYAIIPKKLLSSWKGTPELYVSRNLEGTISRFDYTNNNHIFTIGEGDRVFDTMWSGCGSNCISAYNDSATVDGVALALDAKEIDQVADPTRYDRSSRVRTAYINDVLVLRNKNGYYAVLKLTDVVYEKSISFEYKILPGKLASTWRMDESRYISKPPRGTVSFDVRNNSGKFVIGEDRSAFYLDWSSCSNSCIYLYNDSGLEISRVTDTSQIDQVTDVEKYPKAKRIIDMPIGGVAVLKNREGRYAIIKVTKIVEERYSTMLTFEYKILP